MIPKPLDAFDAGDLQALVDAGAPESRVLEFKRDLNVASPTERIEFLAHVSSFANATGGDLIYGIDAPSGTAVSLPGLGLTDPDAITGEYVGCHARVRDARS
jgi:predicted HTH transcriptional regulator